MNQSETPRTDLEELKLRPRYGGLVSYEFARQLERELKEAKIPICVGKPIIQILAKEGQWVSEKGSAIISADCLFRKDPYAEIEQWRKMAEELAVELKSELLEEFGFSRDSKALSRFNEMKKG